MSFEYLEPDTLEEAVARLAQDDDTVAVAGGTAFALLLRQGLVRPARVVGLRRIAGLRGIRAEDGGTWIGALETHRDVETSAVVRSAHPSLAAAFATIATIRIRNQATLGGNLAHADPAQDPPPILIALGASVHVAGPGGSRRTLPVEALFEDYYATVLGRGEVIVGVSIPAAQPGSRAVYRKFLPRSADDYATVSVAVSVTLDGRGRVDAARIALGGAGPIPVRAVLAERALVGELPDEPRLDEAADLVRDAVDPLEDVRGSASYKREMARVWVRRALAEAVA